jgi:hypothetical protein
MPDCSDWGRCVAFLRCVFLGMVRSRRRSASGQLHSSKLSLTKELGYKPRPSMSRLLLYDMEEVAIGHWETINGHGGKVRLVRQHIPSKCQESPLLQDGEYVKFYI